MVKKVYKKLLPDQKRRGIMFSSTLSEGRTERDGDTIHEVRRNDPDKWKKIGLLKDDKFFNRSHWNYNIIRKG